MKKKMIITAIAALTLGAVACNNPSHGHHQKEAADKPKGKYYCTMHPDITSDKPGICAKCGMELVERDTIK